jgi:hypothetical protein
MTEIIKGSLVSVVFSIVAFSHTDVDNMFSYNGVPCLLDVIAGTGMILKALDEAIMCMTVGDEREILIPAAEASQTARALGVRMRGILKYELKVIRVVNTPVGATEIAQFFSKGTLTLASLSECRQVKKGPFNISRTYDMFDAVAISEEFRILETLCKEKQTNLSDHGNNSTSEICANNPNRSVQTSSIPFLSNSGSHFLLPMWPISVSRESFLPDLMRLAVSSSSQIIILFDSPADWEEISKNVAKQKAKEQHNILNLSNSSGDKLLLNGVHKTPLVEAGNSQNSPVETPSIPIQDPDLASDISMAVESEETDATKESILTWLRIATNSPSSSSSCRKFSSDGEAQSDLKRSKNHTEKEKEVEKSVKYPLTERFFEADVNHITGENNNKCNTEFSRGHRLALIRFSGWDRGSAPQGRLWDGFWRLYSR